MRGSRARFTCRTVPGGAAGRRGRGSRERAGGPRRHPGRPPILAGDLNADPESTEIRFLRGLTSLAGRSTYFQEAWDVAGDGGRGFTWDHRNSYAAITFEPSRRIDYVLADVRMLPRH